MTEEFHPSWLKQGESLLFHVSERFGVIQLQAPLAPGLKQCNCFFFSTASSQLSGRLTPHTHKMAPRISPHYIRLGLFSVRPFFRIASRSLNASQWLKLAILSQYPGPGGMWGNPGRPESHGQAAARAKAKPALLKPMDWGGEEVIAQRALIYGYRIRGG